MASIAKAAGCEDEGVTPKEVVARWVELFNAGDADGLAALYHDDAINHQFAETPVEGPAAIPEMFRREFAAAEMTCIPEPIHEAGRRRNPGVARSAGIARLRLLHGARRPNRLPARLLGQALVPAAARPAGPPGMTNARWSVRVLRSKHLDGAMSAGALRAALALSPEAVAYIGGGPNRPVSRRLICLGTLPEVLRTAQLTAHVRAR
jgi:hypothetical protein